MREEQKKFHLIILLVIIHVYSAFQIYPQTQTKEKTIYAGKIVQLKSKILKENRRLLVYLPYGYEKSQLRYPVLYLLDGDDHFFYTTGLIQYYNSRELWPPMIVVAIPNTDRKRDLSPPRIEDPSEKKSADNFLQFMKDELFLFVEKEYRAQPYRILWAIRGEACLPSTPS